MTVDRTSDTSPSGVSMAITVGVVHQTAALIRVRTELAYRSSDPHAVEMTSFLADRAVPWLMARELLTTGVGAPTGEGDVHVRPGSEFEGPGVTIIELISPDGAAAIRVKTSDMLTFLARTRQLVPVGTESAHTDLSIDSAVAAVLGTPTA